MREAEECYKKLGHFPKAWEGYGSKRDIVMKITKSRRLIRAGHVARMGERRIAFNILTGKPIRKGTSRKT